MSVVNVRVLSVVAVSLASLACVFQVPSTAGLECNDANDCDDGQECVDDTFGVSRCQVPGTTDPTVGPGESDPSDSMDPSGDPSGSETGDESGGSAICDSPLEGATLCSDTCLTANDGECDDGASGAQFFGCALGSDCEDCGPRGGDCVPDEPGSGFGECSLFAQDCSSGKCVPWDGDGDGSADTTRCVEAGSGGLGDACVSSDGVDDCGVGLLCEGGFCHETCGCGLDTPTCSIPNGLCDTRFPFYTVCRTECDPLSADSCPSGFVCSSFGQAHPFLCYPEFNPGASVGDTCQFINDCPQGSRCVQGPDFCQGEACCAPFCDVTSSTACPDSYGGCTRLYEDGSEANACGEDIGFCSTFDSDMTSVPCPNCSLLLHMDDETFADSGPNQYPVAPSGPPPLVNGRFDAAVSMSAGHLRIAGESFPAYPADFTLDFWLQATSELGAIWSQGDEMTPGGFRVVIGPAATSPGGPGTVAVAAHGTSSGWQGWLTTSVRIDDGAYHHVAVVRTGLTVILFVDGEPLATQDVSGSLHYGADVILGETRQYWNGGLDEVRVVNGTAEWTTAFAPPEVPYLFGGEGKVVFVYSGLDMGNLKGIAGADAVCQQAAQNAGLEGTFLAWLSDDFTSPAARFERSTIPYILVDGTVVATNWDDLVDGSLTHPIDLDEFGQAGPEGSTLVWTGTTPQGDSTGQHCTNWQSDTALGTAGRWDATAPEFTASMDWTTAVSTGCGSPSSVYCFEQ